MAYTIVGKIVDFIIVQQTIIGILHIENKPEKVIAKEADCPQNVVDKVWTAACVCTLRTNPHRHGVIKINRNKHLKFTILPKIFAHPSKSLSSGVPITSMANGV
ncbi:hypothetical protein GOODEAATRI_026453 [Goodea atripinnis]|uniref:Uncharacterized protein n=1 Tax=Goodea atripinnis TaxID=208336 RepID=A0ABV0N4H3_9TELE